jgi:hypothetical protein
MAIDITLEVPIPLTTAACHVPRRRRGRKTAASTLHRWATHGLRGVRLETIQIGGTKCTSVPALQRFFDRLSAPNASCSPADISSPASQHRATPAERELNRRWSRKRHRATLSLSGTQQQAE